MGKNNTTKSNQKDQRLIDAKIPLFQLAGELGNIQKACKAAGIARSGDIFDTPIIFFFARPQE